MNKKIRYLISLLLFISLISCNSLTSRPESPPQSGPRSIILNDKKVSEKDVGGFISWNCYDYSTEKSILLEIGYFGGKKFKNIGFILYDGGNSGEYTHYQRAGLNHRWDWGSNGGNYSFIIEPDGTGLYYDFSTASNGKKEKADSIYKCYQGSS
jgi:hypothetical protein